MHSTARQIITGPGIPANTVIDRVTSTEHRTLQPATASATGVALTVTAGPGNVPTNESRTHRPRHRRRIQAHLHQPQSRLDRTTAAIPTTPRAAAVQAALEALTNIGPGNVSVTGGPGDEKGTIPT